MFDYLYEWIQNIAFYMVMVTAIMHIIPNPDYKRYVRFFTGLVLVIMLAAPFLKLLGLGDSWENLNDSKAYQDQVKKIEQAMQSLERTDTQGDPDDILTEEQRDEIDVEEIKIGR